MNWKQGVAKSFSVDGILHVYYHYYFFFIVAFMAYSPSFYFYFHGMIIFSFCVCHIIFQKQIYTYMYICHMKKKTTRQSLDKYKNLSILQHLASFSPTILSGRVIYY